MAPRPRLMRRAAAGAAAGAAAALALAAGACADPVSPLANLSIYGPGVVAVGDTVRLEAYGNPRGLLGFFYVGPTDDARWSVSDPAVARLEALPPPPDSAPYGRTLVRGVRAGTVEVSVRAGGQRAVTELRVLAAGAP